MPASETNSRQHVPTNINLFKVKNINARKKREICSKLTMKTPERHHWRCSGAFIVKFQYISHLFLVFILLTLSIYLFARVLAKTTHITQKHYPDIIKVDSVTLKMSSQTKAPKLIYDVRNPGDNLKKHIGQPVNR